MARLGIILLLLGLAVSCSTIPDPIPASPEQVETDSLMAIYGKSIVTKNLNYLRYFQLDKKWKYATLRRYIQSILVRSIQA